MLEDKKDQTKMKGVFRNSASNVIQNVNILEDIPYLQEPLAPEVRSELQSLPYWKATGAYETSTEIWQAIEEELTKNVTKLCQQI